MNVPESMCSSSIYDCDYRISHYGSHNHTNESRPRAGARAAARGDLAVTYTAHRRGGNLNAERDKGQQHAVHAPVSLTLPR